MQLIVFYGEALEKFSKSYPESKKPFKAWLKFRSAREWQSLTDVLSFFQSARYRRKKGVARIAFPVGDYYISCRPWVQENTADEDGTIGLFIRWIGDKKQFHLHRLAGMELTMDNVDHYL